MGGNVFFRSKKAWILHDNNKFNPLSELNIGEKFNTFYLNDKKKEIAFLLIAYVKNVNQIVSELKIYSLEKKKFIIQKKDSYLQNVAFMAKRYLRPFVTDNLLFNPEKYNATDLTKSLVDKSRKITKTWDTGKGTLMPSVLHDGKFFAYAEEETGTVYLHSHDGRMNEVLRLVYPGNRLGSVRFEGNENVLMISGISVQGGWVWREFVWLEK